MVLGLSLQAQPPVDRVALVISNDTYGNAPLPNTLRDAANMVSHP